MSRVRLPLALAVSVVALLISACISGNDGGTPFPTATVPPATSGTVETPEGTATPAPPTSTPTPRPTPVAAPSVVAPQPVAFVDALGGRVFDRPIELGALPDGRLFVADQEGIVFVLEGDGGDEDVLLDIRPRVSRNGNEEGLLSVALDPRFESNRHLWVYYSRANPRRSVLSRFTVGPFEADPASELVVLEIAQPFSNHNGGAVRFGFDGMLYLGLGDGGAANDQLEAGQDLSTLLGKVIRIDVRNASAGTPYAVPADNPFAGEPGAEPEIWAYGLRNPWRMAFDPTTGVLWAGDVGQGAREEISVIRRGENYGWDIVEGDICHEPQSGCDTTGLTFPVAVYGHTSERCSVTGGVVYRGTEVPEIAGNYLYADFCTGELWAMPVDGSSEPMIVASGLGFVASFGVDAAGEVYVLRFGQSIARLVSP